MTPPQRCSIPGPKNQGSCPKAALEATQGQILSQSPTDATRFWWHLYGSWRKKPSICPWVASWAGQGSDTSGMASSAMRALLSFDTPPSRPPKAAFIAVSGRRAEHRCTASSRRAPAPRRTGVSARPEAGSHLRSKDSCITQLKAQGTSPPHDTLPAQSATCCNREDFPTCELASQARWMAQGCEEAA